MQPIALVTSCRRPALPAIAWCEESRDVGLGEVEGGFWRRPQTAPRRGLSCGAQVLARRLVQEVAVYGWEVPNAPLFKRFATVGAMLASPGVPLHPGSRPSTSISRCLIS